jgi:hypothetical protein
LLVLVLVLVKMEIQVEVEVQQRSVLGVEVAMQHTAVVNLQANTCKQEQVEGVEQRQEEVEEHPTEPSEHGVESYEVQGYPKPSGHVHFVVLLLRFEHVLE